MGKIGKKANTGKKKRRLRKMEKKLGKKMENENREEKVEEEQ